MDATFSVVAEHGVEGVGVRAVARVLGVDPKSLYNHVDGKDGLLDALAERVLGSIVLPAPTGDLRTDVRAVADAFRDAALVHPQAAALVLTRQLGSLDALAPTAAALAVLREAGLPPAEAVHALRALVALVIGVLLREVSAGPTYGTTDAVGIARREEELRAAGFADTATHLARFDAAAEYTFAIDLATDALVARATRESGDVSSR